MTAPSWLTRLKGDYQIATITSFGACAAVGILPFSIYRFISGNPIAGLLDLTILTLICLAVAHAWLGGKPARSAMLLAVINSVGCLASAAVLGPTGLFWMYPALLANFLLLGPRAASLVTALSFVVLTVQGSAYESPSQLAMFLTSATVCSLIAFVFATRAENQRQELETLASLDSLTGCLNRRAMVQELQLAVDEFRRQGTSYGLVMLDLDHFKRINDDHGHEAGDEVLVGFVLLLRRSMRKSDRCFRFGGEEFVVLMPGTDRAALMAVDNSLRARVADELNYRGRQVTVSIGAAALLPAEDWQSWLGRADVALYEAKEAGRNRTVVDNEVPGVGSR